MDPSQEQNHSTERGNPEHPHTDADQLRAFMRTMQEGVQQAMEKINQSIDSKIAMALNVVN